MTPHLVLIGLRGSGKSTVARLLGERLGRAVVDLDEWALALLGVATAAEAWAAVGEMGFREAETAALRAALASTKGDVIALGGGTPTAPGASALLQAARADGLVRVVYLRATPAALRARLTADDPSRPSLTGAGTLDEIPAVFAARDGLYRAIADAVVEVDALTPRQAADAVLEV